MLELLTPARVVSAPAGDRRHFKRQEIRFQPEASGDCAIESSPRSCPAIQATVRAWRFYLRPELAPRLIAGLDCDLLLQPRPARRRAPMSWLGRWAP